jgi:rare lipoprotein A
MKRLVIAILSLLLTMSVIKPGMAATGLASYYAYPFHGRKMANGKRFDMNKLTAAHKTLPFGTKLRVCYKRCTIVTITDRGPYIGKRVIDLSLAAAKAIGSFEKGVAKVGYEIIHKDNSLPTYNFSFLKDFLEFNYQLYLK